MSESKSVMHLEKNTIDQIKVVLDELRPRVRHPEICDENVLIVLALDEYRRKMYQQMDMADYYHLLDEFIVKEY